MLIALGRYSVEWYKLPVSTAEAVCGVLDEAAMT
jgi:hypothetical protein